MGHIESVGNMLKKIDVFCMNSRFEGLGLVMLEAMFFSKPIIAAESVKDGGFLARLKFALIKSQKAIFGRDN